MEIRAARTRAGVRLVMLLDLRRADLHLRRRCDELVLAKLADDDPAEARADLRAVVVARLASPGVEHLEAHELVQHVTAVDYLRYANNGAILIILDSWPESTAQEPNWGGL